MSNIDSLRRTVISAQINNVDISENINKHLISATFTDVEDGASDDLEIQLEDRDNLIVGQWLNAEVNKRGATSTGSSGTTCPYTEPSNTLKKGSGGNGVRWLQWHLNETISAGLAVDGSFGNLTKAAVLKFQKKYGMTQSGTVNSSMRSKLKSLVKPTTTSKASKNAQITMSLKQMNWDSDGKDMVLNCGIFELDDVSMSGPPQTVTLKATACSFNSGIRTTKHTRTFQNTTLGNIAGTLAKAAGYTLMYLAGSAVKYTKVSQKDQTDIVFLQSLCSMAGLSLKVANGALIIFDQSTKESAQTVRTIKRGDGTYSTYKFQTSLSNTAYSACHVKYTTTSGKEIEYTYTPPGGKYDEDNVLEVSNEKAETTAEAKQIAIAKLRAANKGETTGSYTMPGDVTLYAGLTVQVSGWGAFDGKYIIEEAKHSVRKSGGYTTTIKLRQVITGY